MHERLEAGQRTRDGIVVGAECDRNRGSRQRVRSVVLAFDLQVGHRAEPVLDAADSHHEQTLVVDESRVARSAAHPHVAMYAIGCSHGNVVRAGLAQLAHFRTHDVVGRVEDREGRRRMGSRLVRALDRPQHVELRIRVCFERAMPVDVIGRYVEQDRHVGREAVRGGKLVRRHLGHVHARFAGSHRIEADLADVSDRARGETAFAQDVRGERRGGGLAVRARDGDPSAIRRALAPRELDLADEFAGELFAGDVELVPIGNAGTRDAQVEPTLDAFERVIAECPAHAFAGKRFHERAGVVVLGSCRDEELAHAIAQQPCAIPRNRLPALAQAENQDFPDMRPHLHHPHRAGGEID